MAILNNIFGMNQQQPSQPSQQSRQGRQAGQSRTTPSQGGFLGVSGPTLMALGAGIAGGDTWGEGVGQGFQLAGQTQRDERDATLRQKKMQAMQDYRDQRLGISREKLDLSRSEIERERAKEDRRRNMTRDYLLGQGVSEDEADFLASQPKVLQSFLKQRMGGEPTGDMQEFEFAREQGYQGSFMDFMRDRQKPSAQQAEISEIMNTYNVDRQTAAGIATGAITIKTNPVTGNQELVNAATGEARMLDYGDAQPAPAQGDGAPRQGVQAPRDQADRGAGQQRDGQARQVPDTLWGMSEGVTGVVPSVQEFGQGFTGQVGVDIADEELLENRQTFRNAQNGLIRSLSINPRFPVAEMERIRREVNIEPGAFTDTRTLKSRMRSVDAYLRGRLERERRAARDRTLPAETRQNAAAAANNIQNFLDVMGVPQGGERRGQSQQDNSVGGGAAPPADRPRVSGEADWNALPPGTEYIDPNGVTRRKGGQ